MQLWCVPKSVERGSDSGQSTCASLAVAFLALLLLFTVPTTPAAALGPGLLPQVDEGALVGAVGMARRSPHAAALAAPMDTVGEVSAAAWLESWGIQPEHAADERLEAVSSDSVAPMGNDFPIASRVDPFSDTEDLDAASVAYNPARGEYLAVWHAFVPDTLLNVYAQRLSATGNPIGSRIVVSQGPGLEIVPDVAYEATTGTYWVTWTEIGSGDSREVVLRRISGIGQLLGLEFSASGASVNQAFASRIACGSGRCAVAWQNIEPDGDSHVLLRGYRSNTAALTPPLLLTDVVGVAAEPDISYNPADQHFAVAWQKSNGVNWDVWMMPLNRDLVSFGARPVSTAALNQQRVRIAYGGGAGRYLVVWEDARSNVSWDVYGQLVSRSGSLVGSALAIFQGPFHDVKPAVVGRSGTSEFAVAFQRDTSGAQQFQIFGARVAGSGAVGASFPIRLWHNTRWSPALAQRAGSSDYLAVWTDRGTDIQNDIQAQRFFSSGSLTGNLVNVSVGRKGQETPATAYNSLRNEYLTVWADYRSGDDYDLYVRRVSPAGAVLGDELLIASTSFLYGVPEIAYNSELNEYFVVWQEITGPTTGYEIYGQRLSGVGIPRGPVVYVSRDTNAVNEGSPTVVYNTVRSEYLVAWHAFTGGNWRIWSQRISSSGALVGFNRMVSDFGHDALATRIAYNPRRNQYVLIWLDWRNDRGDVYGQRLDVASSPIGGNFAISTANGTKGRCDIDYSASDRTFLVVWGDNRNPSPDLYGQMLDGTASLTGSNFSIAADPGISEVAPLVTWDPVSGDYLIAWWELHSATNYDVWACTVSGTGVVAGDWFPVTQAFEVQRAAKISRATNRGRVLVTWQDFRNGNYDIYGRMLRLTPDNTLTVTKAGTGSGTVTSSPAGIQCGSTCSAEFDQGAVVSLTASAAPGSTFAGWGGGCSGTGACNVTLDADTTVTAIFNVAGSGSCSPSSTALCLPEDNRFRVSVTYNTVQGGGLSGNSQAIPLDSLGLTSGGLFYFNNPTDPQFLVKVLNGCGINNRFWVYYAATTDVGFTMTVTDTVANQTTTYFNPDLHAADPVTDTQAFATCGQGAASPKSGFDAFGGSAPTAVAQAVLLAREAEALLSGATLEPTVPLIGRVEDVDALEVGSCMPSSTVLCLPGTNRFRVSVTYDTVQGGGLSGDSPAIPLDSLGLTSGGLFYFNNPTDPQFLVKVLNGCGINNRYWVYYAATTDVGFTMTVTDTVTQQTITYSNPDLNAAVPVTDSQAFATCP